MYKTCLLIVLPLFLSLSITAQLHKCSHHQHAGMRAAADASRSDSVDIHHTHIYFDLTQWSEQEFAANAELELTVLQDNTDRIVFDLEGLTVDSVILNEAQLDFDHQEQLLVCLLPDVVNSGESMNVKVYYHGQGLTDASGWGGIYWQSNQFFNLGVGFDADPHSYGRVWHPCFDNFVERSTYTLQVLTNGGRTSYAGGVRSSVEVVGEDSLLTTWELEEEIPSYLASIAAGMLDHEELNYESITGTDVPVWLAAQSGNLSNMLTSFQNLFPCLTGYEEAFGPYRWPRVGYVLVPFSSGAMEHATNIAYPAFAANGSLGFQSLMAHELSHHWWGDLVTCASQEDMWINEGMASYSEALFFEYLEGTEAYKDYVRDNHKDVLLYAHIDDGERLPVSGISHEYTYGSHVYNKGADVAHTMRTYLGDDYFSLMTQFLEDHQYQAVSSEMIRDYLDPLTSANMVAFFDNWIFAPGFPEFRVTNVVTEEASDGYETDVTITQFLHHAPEFYTDVPLELTILTANEEITVPVLAGSDLLVENIASAEVPFAVFLNRGEKINQACLAEELVIDEGITTFNYAEFRMDVDAMEGAVETWVRVENHWTEADDQNTQVDLALASDRFWSVYHDPSVSITGEVRLRFYGDENSGNYFDPIYFADMEALNYPEDSLVAVYRESPSALWSIVENADLSTQGSNTNYAGYLDVPYQGPGDYAWAYRTGLVNVSIEEAPAVKLWPNPVSDVLNIKGFSGQTFRIFDARGNVVLEGRVSQSIDLSSLASGSYHVRFEDGSVFPLIKR